MISTQKFTEVGLVPVFGEIIISIPHCRKGDDTITLRNDEWEDRENLMLKLQEFKEQGYALSLQRGNQMILIQGYNPKNNCWVTGRGTANTGYFIPFEEGDSASSHMTGVLINNNGTIQYVYGTRLFGFPNMSVFDSWGFQLKDIVPANIADKQKIQDLVMSTRMAGQLNP